MSRQTFEEILERDGVLIYTHVGDSMYPLIHTRDLLVIQPYRGSLHRYDIPLYKRDSGQYVLHRVLWARRDGYVICGDNRYIKEYGITDRQVIGVLTDIIRDGRTVPVDKGWYRLYAHLWCDLFAIRCAILLLRDIPRRLNRKLKKKD